MEPVGSARASGEVYRLPNQDPRQQRKLKVCQSLFRMSYLCAIIMKLFLIFSEITAAVGTPERRFPSLLSGVILTFGQGDVGQLGLGPDIMEKGRPALIPNLGDLIDVRAGGMHTICLNKKGEVPIFRFWSKPFLTSSCVIGIFVMFRYLVLVVMMKVL